MIDEGLKQPVKKFEDTFSGEQVVLDHLRAERPDVAWFVDPPRVYSINDEPNTCRRVAGFIFRAIVAMLFVFGVAAAVLPAHSAPRASAGEAAYSASSTVMAMFDRDAAELNVTLTKDDVPQYNGFATHQACVDYMINVDMPDTIKVVTESSGGHAIFGEHYTIVFTCAIEGGDA